MSKWLLPERLADILPVQARYIEACRRDLLDLYRSYGYELVQPPLAEYIDSLLSGNGRALNVRTSKLVDQLSGRTMGVRADITPQVARIDAHLLNREGVTRLCYCGPVLHARPSGLLSDRELLQIGAEIFGYDGVEADIEIIQLALASVECAHVSELRLDLNYPAIGMALIHHDAALAEQASEVCHLLSLKDMPSLRQLCLEQKAQPETLQALVALTQLYGQANDTVARARKQLPDLPAIRVALDNLETLIHALPDHQPTVDLADMGSSYGYHSGVVFSLYAPGWHDALVRGGRYDGVGKHYGRERPATGFSLDLRKLSAGLPPAQAARAIRAPWGLDPQLAQALKTLRQQGEVVIQMLPNQVHDVDEFHLDRELILQDGQWQVRAICTNSAN